MTFLEAIYGSQTAEIKQNGGDANRGKKVGTIFLTVFLIVALTAIVLMFSFLVPALGTSFGSLLRSIFGYTGGRAIGKILAAIAFVLIYFVVNKTIGTEENYRRLVDNFNQYPEKVRGKANKILLVPFFVALLVLIVFGVLL